LKISVNVKIAMQCLESFGGGQMPQMPPLVARLLLVVHKFFLKL